MEDISPLLRNALISYCKYIKKKINNDFDKHFSLFIEGEKCDPIYNDEQIKPYIVLKELEYKDKTRFIIPSIIVIDEDYNYLFSSQEPLPRSKDVIYPTDTYTVIVINIEPQICLLAIQGISDTVLKLYAQLFYERMTRFYLNETINHDNKVFGFLNESSQKETEKIESIKTILEKYFNKLKKLPEFKIEQIALFYAPPHPVTYYKMIGEYSEPMSYFEKKIKKGKGITRKNMETFFKFAKKKTTIRSFYNDSALLILLHKERVPSVKERNILDLYLNLFIIELYPFIISNLNRTLGQHLTATLAAEIFDPLSISFMITKDIQKSLDSDVSKDQLLIYLEKLRGELQEIEQRLKIRLESSLVLEKDKKHIDLKELIDIALKSVPQLRREFTIDDQDLKAESFLYIYKNAMVAVLVHLFMNIVQHTKPEDVVKIKNTEEPDGKAIVWLKSSEINLAENFKAVKLIIEDNGKMLPDTISQFQLNQLFEPGYKMNPDSPGAGMGLSYCRYLIEEVIGGEIALKKENNGLVVEITLPIVKNYADSLGRYDINDNEE